MINKSIKLAVKNKNTSYLLYVHGAEKHTTLSRIWSSVSLLKQQLLRTAGVTRKKKNHLKQHYLKEQIFKRNEKRCMGMNGYVKVLIFQKKKKKKAYQS